MKMGDTVIVFAGGHNSHSGQSELMCARMCCTEQSFFNHCCSICGNIHNGLLPIVMLSINWSLILPLSPFQFKGLTSHQLSTFFLFSVWDLLSTLSVPCTFSHSWHAPLIMNRKHKLAKEVCFGMQPNGRERTARERVKGRQKRNSCKWSVKWNTQCCMHSAERL